MLKKSALIIAMSLAAGSAFAHAIPAATGGNPYTINEQPLVMTSTTNGAAMNVLFGDTQLGGAMFDVTTAGSLDVFSDDQDNLESWSNLYVFKLDAGGQDWTLVGYNDVGATPTPTSGVNNWGVPVTGWDPAQAAAGIPNGTADPGLTQNFDTGTYLALSVGDALYLTGFTPLDPTSPLAGVGTAKLSLGFTTAFAELAGTLGVSPPTPIDIHVRNTAGSLAVFTPAVQAPAQVPVPGAIWLMGSVLAGFGAFGRKKAIAA